MMIGQIIKEARERKYITQQELADRVPGLGRTSISKYENGAPIPDDVLCSISEALDDPVLRILTAGTTSSRLVFDQVKVDFYITGMKAIEEMEETIEDIKRVMEFAYNVDSIEQLVSEQKEAFDHMLDEVEDTNHALDMLDIAAHKMGADLRKRNRRCLLKYHVKGYISDKFKKFAGEAV